MLARVWLVATPAAADADAILHGTVVDRASKQPVAGATIVIGSELAASGDDGTFEITLPAGKYTIAVTADWITPASQPVTLAPGARVDVTIEVEPAATPAGEQIQVTGVAPSAPGEISVEAGFARVVPGGGDAAKVVQSLPAVARPAAGSTDIVIWGAAPNESRVFVDGVPVMELYHLGGYRGAIGNDLIGDIHLTPAAFGVDRGGAIGGVIDVAMADPANAPGWRVQADVLDGTIEGRAKLGSVTIAAAIRQSWLDRTVAIVENPQQVAPDAPIPQWTDGQIVARAKLADDVTLSAWVLGSYDSLDQVLPSDDPATQTDQRNNQYMLRGQVTLRHDRPDGYDSATVWFGRDHTAENLQVGLIPADTNEDDWVGGARAVQRRRVSDAVTVTSGIDLDGQLASLSRFGSLTIPAREGDIYIFGQPPGSDVNADAWHATTIDTAAHVAAEAHAGPWSATLGVRFDAWLLTASRLTPKVGSTPDVGSQQILDDADPRASVSYRASDELVLRADGGLYHQARDASDTSAVFGTPSLGIEEGWHAVVGAQWHRAPLALEIEGYARWLDDLVARDIAVTPPLAHSLTQEGVGTVYGVQTTARILAWNGLSGWLSYNLSQSMRQDSPTQPWRLFDYDQTNGFIAVAGWQRGRWSVGTRVRYATGEPRTPVIGAYFDAQTGRYDPIVGPQNSIRLPAFFAADARAQCTFSLGAVKSAVYLEVQNLTNHANAEQIIYSADYSQHGYLTGLPILAIAGLRFEQ